MSELPRQSFLFTVDMHIHPDAIEQFKNELLEAVELVRREETCLEVVAHQSDDDPAAFLMYERWSDGPTFWDVVRARPYFRHYKAATAKHHRVEPRLRRWTVLGQQSTEEGRR